MVLLLPSSFHDELGVTSLGAWVSSQMFDETVNSGHSLTVFFADFKIKFTLAAEIHFDHVECVEAAGGEGLGESDGSWVDTGIV